MAIKSHRKFSIYLLILIFTISHCSSDHSSPAPSQGDYMRLLGTQTRPILGTFQNTVVGGISGIDMSSDGKFYLLSDDSDYNPNRFYTATLDYDNTGFRSVNLISTVFPKTPAGVTFPSIQTYFNNNGGEFADSESIRYNSSTGTLFWTSEGTFINNITPTQPFIRQMTLSGDYVSEVATPSLFRYTPTIPNTGLILNATFEAMSLIPGTDELWVAIEAPLLQDGPRPTFYNHGAAIRIARINYKTNQQIAQYAYVPEQNPLMPSAGGTSNNGIPEILAMDNQKLLVLERAFSTGYSISKGNTIRIYEVDFTGATDVQNINPLTSTNYTAAKKTLVYDFANAGLSQYDNVESMCWGKDLANGNRSLVLVTDDNFSTTQLFQFFVLEVLKL